MTACEAGKPTDLSTLNSLAISAFMDGIMDAKYAVGMRAGRTEAYCPALTQP